MSLIVLISPILWHNDVCQIQESLRVVEPGSFGLRTAVLALTSSGFRTLSQFWVDWLAPKNARQDWHREYIRKCAAIWRFNFFITALERVVTAVVKHELHGNIGNFSLQQCPVSDSGGGQPMKFDWPVQDLGGHAHISIWWKCNNCILNSSIGSGLAGTGVLWWAGSSTGTLSALAISILLTRPSHISSDPWSALVNIFVSETLAIGWTCLSCRINPVSSSCSVAVVCHHDFDAGVTFLLGFGI